MFQIAKLLETIVKFALIGLNYLDGNNLIKNSEERFRQKRPIFGNIHNNEDKQTFDIVFHKCKANSELLFIDNASSDAFRPQ